MLLPRLLVPLSSQGLRAGLCSLISGSGAHLSFDASYSQLSDSSSARNQQDPTTHFPVRGISSVADAMRRASSCSTDCSTSYAACSSTTWHRGFAKAAAKPDSAAPPTVKLTRNRRSQQKIFSCRNDRVRAMFEQIWPTAQLSEEEAQLFKRNSRVFVTELGRSIPLTIKFQLGKAGVDKVPHHDVKRLLYESDLHLDAVGEHPRYMRIRRLRAGNHAAKLQAVRKLRLLLGFARRYTLQDLHHLSLLQPGPDRVWRLITAMESTLTLTALRMGFAHDSLAATGMVERGVLRVNGCRPVMPRRAPLQPADVVQPAGISDDWFKQYTAGQLGPGLMKGIAREWAVPGPLGWAGPS